jgi:phage tail tape-measure protein
MTNNEPESNLQHQIIPPPQPSEPTANDTSIASNPHPARKPDATMSEPTGHPPSAKTIGAVGGGVAGAAIGHSLIGGKLGTAIGVVLGAIAGGVTADTLAESIDRVTDEIEPTMGLKLGANDAPVNLPAHYTWTELQALSKPQR